MWGDLFSSREGWSAVAMGAERGQGASLQVEMVCLDELVPGDDLYRRIDGLVDWGFVRPAAASYYAEGVGRPSLDPVVLVKLMLAGALEGVGSMRELLRVCSLRVDLRRFLGYGLGERLPVHQTVSDAYSRRFLDGALFETLFARTVALCREHGLLEGTHLSVDGFHLEANAALQSLRASMHALAVAEPGSEGTPGACRELREGQPEAVEGSAGLAPAEGPAARLRLAGPGDPPAGKPPGPLNERLRSRTDPDARLRRKPSERVHLVYRAQVAIDPKRRCVVACLAERADGFEGDGAAPLLDRARFHLPWLRSFAADAGYAAQRVWEDAQQRGLEAFLPPQPHMLPDPTRTPRTRTEELAGQARKRCSSPAGRQAARRRLSDAEGVIGEGKLRHGLSRARCRGLPLVEIQVTLGCAAINLKRLATHAAAPAGTAAENAKAAENSPRPSTNTPSAAAADTPADREHEQKTPSTLIWTFTINLN